VEFKLFINSLGLKVPRFRGTPISYSSQLIIDYFKRRISCEVNDSQNYFLTGRFLYEEGFFEYLDDF